MELIAQLLLVLVALSSLFQMSQWTMPARLIASLLLGIASYMAYPWVIEQSKEQLNIWLNDPIMMQNLAVFVAMEALLFILLDFALLKKCFGQPVRKVFQYAAYFPGVLLLAVVLYVQMLSFYTFSAIDFDALGIYFSLVLAILIFLGPMLVRWVIPEDYLRMELRYILNFGQILGGIVITVFCQGLSYPQQQSPVEWKALLILMSITGTMLMLGWLGAKYGKWMKSFLLKI